MPDSLVLQLQELASGNAADVPELLRKSLLVASKLSLGVFRTWIEHELNGYRCPADDVPDYRRAFAQVRAFNPVRRDWMPLIFPDSRTADKFQCVLIRDPIGNLVHLLQTSREREVGLSIPFTEEETLFLMEGQSSRVPFPPARFVDEGKVATIIDVVRTKILQWSLELESLGVMGEGMRFTSEEKSKAVASSTINIQNFQGILGDVAGQNTITQNLSQVVRVGDFESLAAYLRSHKVDDSDIAELKKAFDADPKPGIGKKLGPKTSAWMGGMLTKAANGTWDVSVEVAGALISAAILYYYFGPGM